MQKKFIILISIIAISLLVSVGAYLFVSSSTNNSPPTTGLTTCNVLQQNENGINIVLFATEETAKKYMNYFLSIVPFNKNTEKFNFYFIPPTQYVPECEIYQGIAILCYSSDIIKKAASCPNDYVVVLDKQPSSIRSSAYKGIMSLNTNHPLTVFAHEFGHAIANFAEEYMVSGTSVPRGSKNCQKDCSDFNEFPGQFNCYEGCTNSDHSREFENGFMRSLQADRYGSYDELLLQKSIDDQYKKSSPITGLAISDNSCEDQQYYLIEGNYQNDQIEITSKELLQGCPNTAPQHGLLDFSVLNNADEIIYSSSLNPEYIFTTNDAEDETITSPPIKNDLPFIITMPSTGQEKTLEISDETGILISVRLDDTGARPCKT